MAQKNTGGRKGRKIGRNKVKCQAYKAFNRRERNKLRWLKKNQPKNLQNIKQLEEQIKEK